MKQILILQFALLFFVSCGDAQKESNKNSKAAPQSSDSNSSSGLKMQKACETIDINTIAELLDRNASEIQMQDMSYKDNPSVCYYFTKDGARKLYLRLAWKSEKAEENKLLETQYKRLLTTGEKKITYVEHQNQNNQQILSGNGKDRGDQYVHVVRKRIGNASEIQLELVNQTEDNAINTKLIQLVNSIK